ncbi:MAG: ankyrin repeat domain-containing protein [Candidatus Thiodiazotropha sp.]
MKQDNSLLKIVYANEENLLEQVRSQLQAGADPNEHTEYFETPLRVSSRLGRFDVVKLLFEYGADSTHLNWTPLFHAIAYGSIQQVKVCVESGADLNTRDTWERTPFLLAIQSGDADKVGCLIDAGADITVTGRCNQPALEYAIQMDNANMLTFLIQKGFDFEEHNSFGYTPLMQAAADGAINCVNTLLKHGADIYKKDRSQFSQRTAIAQASTLEIAEVLAGAGDDLNQLEGEVRANLLKLGNQEKLTVDKKEYLSQKNRKFGTSNPQKCEVHFWYDMVRCNAGAWKAREQFDDKDSFNDQPVWCYERFGKSITSIGNGEFIEIAGEHEDSYDQDFCIYNEVFHHKGNGKLAIYQYPKDDFPPTDFHTATLVNGHIYIIGNLGYPKDRTYGVTPVYKLDISSFRIQKIETAGECPGWIYNHSANLDCESIIRIQGGEIVEKTGDDETHQFNEFDFELDLIALKWTKYDHTNRNGNIPFLSEEYKRFNSADQTLLAVESKNEWRLLKVIAVHRIDITEGQQIQFENETVTASSDDFLFVVAYSTSKPFGSFSLLEKAVENKSWKIESKCRVCRTIAFPEYGRYMGFGDVTEEEREAFKAWKASFERRQAKIA